MLQALNRQHSFKSKLLSHWVPLSPVQARHAAKTMVKTIQHHPFFSVKMCCFSNSKTWLHSAPKIILQPYTSSAPQIFPMHGSVISHHRLSLVFSWCPRCCPRHPDPDQPGRRWWTPSRLLGPKLQHRQGNDMSWLGSRDVGTSAGARWEEKLMAWHHVQQKQLRLVYFFWGGDGTGEFEDFKNAQEGPEVVVDALKVDDSKSMSLMAV